MIESVLEAHGLRPAPARPRLPGGPQNVAEILDRPVAEHPEREALVGRHARFSFAALDREVARAQHALAALGVGPGDRVAACLPNDADIVIAFLACMRLGALWVGVNRALAPPEKAYILADCGARLLLAAPDAASQIEAQGAQSSAPLRIVRCDPEEPDRDAWRRWLAAAPASPAPRAAIDPFGPAAIAYTSGTTGFPKGAVHSQHNLLLPGAVTCATGRYAPGIRHGVVLPLTILNLMVLGPCVAYQAGSCCVAMDRIDPVGLAKWVRRERVGHFAGVPTIFHDLLTHPDVKAEDLVSLVSPEVGGAECPEEFRALYRERFGAEVKIGYGMTEAPTAVTRSDGHASPLPGLCGKALPQVEIEIRGKDERVLPANEVGEICVRAARSGPFAGLYTPMLGYWNQPEATAEALRGGVYHSGDLGLLDAQGTLFIRGRRAELILRGGANVYPAEVERVLQADARVAAAAVLGRPDPRLGQRVVAAVQLAPGARASAEELLARCREQLARYKVPDQLVFVAQLPRNAMSKVVKRALEPLFES